MVGGLGVEKMNAVMPDIIKHSERTDIAPHVKDGYIMMFIYMPSVFPDEFTKYIGQVMNSKPILANFFVFNKILNFFRSLDQFLGP